MPNPEFDVGTYWAEFISMRDDKSPNTGTAYVALRFRILRWWHNGAWENAYPVDRDRDVRMFVTEKAEPYTMDRLIQLGFNGDFDHPEFTVSPHPEREGVQLVCRHQYRNDR